jgi:hypothetical protein
LSLRINTVPSVLPRHATRSAAGFSAAARVGGAVLGLGYLTGLVNGPLVAVVGGLALTTFGRSLMMDRAGQTVAVAGLAVIAGALGIAALRWGTLELAELRSVQAVLGPTIVVGPQAAAAATTIATIAASLALGLWVAALPTRGFAEWAATSMETLLVALALVTAFWGPKVLLGSAAVPSSEVLGSLGSWAAAATVVTVVGIGGGHLARALPQPVRSGLTVAALVGLAVAAGLIGSTL